MIKDKRLTKLIEMMVKASFNGQNQLVEKKVIVNINLLKQMPTQKSLPALKSFLKRLVRQSKQTELEIETASRLEENIKAKLKVSLEKEHQIATVTEKVNSSLLGGIKVKIGDFVYDDSVSQRINQIKEHVYGYNS